MDVLDQLALRRAHRQVAPRLDAGERVLTFDAGTVPDGQKVICVATTRALYVNLPGGRTARIDYTEIARAEGRSCWLALQLHSGAELVIDFRGSRNGLTAVVVDQVQAAALQPS